MSNIILNPPSDIKFVDYRQKIWGDSFTWSFARTMKQVTKITVHHSVTKLEATPDDIALLHKARGWAGIGYHLVITKDGTVWYCGDIGTARAAVANNNEKTIAILLVGTFMNGAQPTAAQIESCSKLCHFFMEKYPALTEITGWEDIIGHQEAIKFWSTATSTACPGDTWKAGPKPVFNQVRDFKVSPVTPQPNPQPPTPTPPSDTLFRVMQGTKQLGAFKRNPLDYIKDLEKTLNGSQSTVFGTLSDSEKIAKLKEILGNR